MSNRTIYNALVAAGMTPEGALSVMGNMMAESTMKSNIAQRGMTKLTDDQYTAATDNGLLDFVNDSVGYGLCQWTFNTRKAALLACAKNRGVSVGDEDMQVQFCIRELQSEFPMLFWTLCTSHDLYDCTKQVCEKYENPAVHNVDTRYQYALDLQNKLMGSEAMAGETKHDTETANDAFPVFPPDPSVMVIQMVMNYNGYWDKPDGQKTKEFFDALRTFVNDMEAC